MKTLVFLRSLLLKEPRLEGMLESGDRRVDGRWKGDGDEPERSGAEGTGWWELGLLSKGAAEERVRKEAKKLARYVRD